MPIFSPEITDITENAIIDRRAFPQRFGRPVLGSGHAMASSERERNLRGGERGGAASVNNIHNSPLRSSSANHLLNEMLIRLREMSLRMNSHQNISTSEYLHEELLEVNNNRRLGIRIPHEQDQNLITSTTNDEFHSTDLQSALRVRRTHTDLREIDRVHLEAQRRNEPSEILADMARRETNLQRQRVPILHNNYVDPSIPYIPIPPVPSFDHFVAKEFPLPSYKKALLLPKLVSYDDLMDPSTLPSYFDI